MKSIGLTALALASVIFSASAQQPRTDINPALRYYQAFTLTPDLSPADHDYLFTNYWGETRLPERFGELISRYDPQFQLVRQAAQATGPCDWGIDWSAGPATLLPHLARCKAVVVTARLRALWDLQNGRQKEARDDLLAAFALGRNASRDGSLISVLVQIAVEHITCSTVAENFHRFSADTLKELADGIDAAPARGTIAAAIPLEKSCFHDWLVNRILALQKDHPGNDSAVMAILQKQFVSMGDSDGEHTDLWEPVSKAAGGTSAGLVKLLRDEEPLYARLAIIMALPQPAYEEQMKQFTAQARQSTNPLVSLTFPALEKARPREFSTLAKLAMVRAAVEYKLHGEAGLKRVMDPFANAPFMFQRFVFEGVDRGFELRSVYAGRGFQEVQIFVEKEGPPFFCDGPYTGKPRRP